MADHDMDLNTGLHMRRLWARPSSGPARPHRPKETHEPHQAEPPGL